MSHFSVLVIGENVEDQLAPYQENNMDDCPKEYLEFNDIEEEHKKEYLTEELDMLKTPLGELIYSWDRKFTDKEKERFEKVKIKKKDHFKTFDDYMKEFCGFEDGRDNETRKYGYYENPNSKWDWYSIGGRWAGSLKLKKDVDKSKFNNPNFSWGWDEKAKKEVLLKGLVDSALKKDIDFSRDEEAYKQAEIFWELYVEDRKPKNKEEKEMIKLVFYKKEYYTKRYKDKKTYATLCSEFSTHAVLINGKWLEQGEMGWFGCSSETPDEAREWKISFFDRFINKLPDDTQLTIVDCHI